MTYIIPEATAACSPIGCSWDQTWRGFLDGSLGFGKSPSVYAWPEGPLLGSSRISEQEVPYADRMKLLIGAVVTQSSPAVRAAIQDATGKRLHVILASSHGDPAVATEIRTSRVDADFEEMVFKSHAPTISRFLDVPYQFTMLHGACASGVIAVVQANYMLRANLADHVLVISIDALSLLAYMGFRAVGAMDPQACKPFGEGGRGMSVGEGAVVLLLSRERARRAASGGAVVVRGGAWNSDGSGGVEPSEKGLMVSIRAALEEAQLQENDIDFVYWHGTGTKRNDEAELSVCQALWPGGRVPAGASTKGNIAHTMGASAAFNVAAASETLRSSLLPGLPYQGAARFNHMRLATGTRELPEARNGICVAMGFGGINAAVVLGRDA